MSSAPQLIYEYIEPFKRVFYDKYYKEKIQFGKEFNTFMTKVYDTTNNNNKCVWIYKLFNYLLLFVLFICILWVKYDIFTKNVYLINATISNFLKYDNIILKNIPEFNQLNNIIYFADNFSIDIYLILFILVSVIILGVILYYYYVVKLEIILNEFNYIIVLCLIIIISGIIYIIYNFTHVNNASRGMNLLIKLVYKNINLDFINSQGLCNYINKKNELDTKFEYGKCNDIKNNSSIEKLLSYIKGIMNEAYNNDKLLTLEKFKTLKDAKGIYYKTKISSAIYTYTLITYYNNNNLTSELKDILSTYNLIKILFKSQINPLMNLRYDSLLPDGTNSLIKYDNPNIKTAFYDNKDIYYYVYNDYFNTLSNIDSLVVDIYNICKYKMFSVYSYYLFITLVMAILFTIYFIYNYFNFK
jgi:hypothetical protein